MRRVNWIGAVGAVVYLVGYVVASAMPGGGDTKDSDFEKFYVTDDRSGLAVAAVVGVILGALALLWLLHSLRERDDRPLAAFGFAAGAVGLVSVMAGFCVMGGPAGAQLNGDVGFVGVPIARALSQSGWALVLLPGALALALGIAALSWSGRRSGAMSGWVAIAGLVVAVLQLGSYFYLPSLLIPVWMLLAAVFAAPRGAVASRT